MRTAGLLSLKLVSPGVSSASMRRHRQVFGFTRTITNILLTRCRSKNPSLAFRATFVTILKIKCGWVLMATGSMAAKQALITWLPGDLKDNWRVGAIWAVPFAKAHSIKLQLHTGAFTASGLDYNIAAIRLPVYILLANNLKRQSFISILTSPQNTFSNNLIVETHFNTPANC